VCGGRREIQGMENIGFINPTGVATGVLRQRLELSTAQESTFHLKTESIPVFKTLNFK
jgi:hypothetical protein